MPRKKKNGHSPGRVPAQAGGPGGNGAMLTRAVPREVSPNTGLPLVTSGMESSQTRDQIVRTMQEMFSHLDPVVIYIVLSEADFKVENAMDALLELSDAAEGKTLSGPPLSGFEMAAALLDPPPSQNRTEPTKVISEGSAVSESSSVESIESRQQLSPETHLTEEFDTLIDQELETLTSLQSHTGIQPSSIPLSSLPSESVLLSSLSSQKTLLAQKTIPEFGQLDVQSDSKLGSSSSVSTPRLGAASPLHDLSFRSASCSQDRDVSVEFSHLIEDSSSRPSAFKAYRRPDNFANSANMTAHSEGLHTPATSWNIQAPEYQPRVGGPVFITPVMQAPNMWSGRPFTAAQWLTHRQAVQPPLRPSATIPKSWTHPPLSRLKLEGQVLVLLRGAPGSGKTTLASAMLEQNPGGIILSTDEYFNRNGVYHYEPDLLGEAHSWNHQRAKEAFEKGFTPIIIDNTNMQCWEMKPYVALALKHKYRVLFREPDTWWKNKPRELEKRTTHGVTREKIRRMLEHQDRYVSVQNIMASQPKPTAVYGVDVEVSQKDPAQQPLPVDLSRPDLVGDSGLVNPGVYRSSSLPDVSVVSQKSSHNSERMGAAEGEIGSYSSKESMFSNEDIVERTGTPESDLLDGEDLDRELDACIPLSGNTKSIINEDLDVLEEKEQPVPFSESIGQRVRRERVRSRFPDEVETSQPLNFSSGSINKPSQQDDFKEIDSLSLKPELLNFVGDWPSESLEARGQRRRKPATQTSEHPDEEALSLLENSNIIYSGLIEHSGCHKTEFQKQLALLQGDENQSLSLARHEWTLETESQIILPDCVHEWKVGRSTDPEKDNSQPQSPQKEPEPNVDEDKKGTEESVAEIQTVTNSEASMDSVNIETADKPSPTTDTTQSSGVEADPNAEVSQEKRKGANRRTGKSCRLALTFTNQSPSSAYPQSTSPLASTQCADLMPPLQPEPMTCLCVSVQSDPQDFALLWRINQQKCSGPESDIFSGDMVILEGNPLRFVPNTNEDTSLSGQGVPYRVCHEKGSQVEESDLEELPFKKQSLEILSCHFKHIPLETLEDLYEKCNQDMDWVTNLLLDSGEQLGPTSVVDDAANFLGTEEDEVPKEEPCDSQMIGLDSDPKVDTVVEQATDVCSNVQIVDPGTSDDCSSAVSTDAGEPKDSAEVDQNEQGLISEQSDQKKHSESILEGADQVATAEVLQCLSRPPNATNPPAGESITQQDPKSETESQQASLQELMSISQRPMSLRYLDREPEVWFEAELRQEEEEEDTETEKDVDAITQSILAQLEETRSKKEEERKVVEKERRGQGRNESMDIKMLELKLPTELALQLTELFGPVGVSPGEFSQEDCSVLMDLTFAKLLHSKWKETIQERHRQAALSYHLLQESESQSGTVGEMDSAAYLQTGAYGYSLYSSQSGFQEGLPFMDHWNTFRPPVSLRNIMIEEQVIQDSLEKSRLSRWDVDKKDGAAILKEKQLFTLFPTIDRHFLRDMFKDHKPEPVKKQEQMIPDNQAVISILVVLNAESYSLEQTEQFLHTLLDHGPVKNVVATGAAPECNERHRSPSKERASSQKRKQKSEEHEVAQFQDTEDPEYEDFRTEALLQRRRQQECFDKAAEAYRQGRKDVASFYAQQGHLHGQKMKEANHRAAVQIFERVNATLLPQNVLDLHGLHVDEALHHLHLVLADKTSEWQQGLCHPQLSVITGRGSHSQGGIARVRPAVLDYLKSQHYRYTEPKPGLIIVTLH